MSRRADELVERADALARNNGAPSDEFQRLRQARDVVDEEGQPVGDPLTFARSKTQLPELARVVKHGESNALYDLELEGGRRIPLGTSADLMSPRKVDAAIADATGVAIPYYGPKRWRSVAAALLAIVEVEDTGSTEAEETRGWLADFAYARGMRTVAVNPESLGPLLCEPEAEPIFRGDDRRLYVRLDGLVRYVTHQIGQRTTRRDLAARLGRLGFRKRQLSARDGQRVRKARFHASPPDFDPEADE